MNDLLMIFVIGAFATYRISDILVNERGPWDICFKFRKLIGIKHDGNMVPEVYPERFLTLLFSCIGCLSVWIGMIFFLIYNFLPFWIFALVSFPFAFSGLAVLIDSHTYKG